MYFSPNFFHLDKEKDLRQKARKPANQSILWIGSRGELKLLFVDMHDVNCVFDRMKKQKEKNFSYDDCEYHLIQGEKVMISVNKKQSLHLQDHVNGKMLVQLVLIMKVLDRAEYITKDEEEWLKKMFKEQPQKAEAFNEFAKEYHAIWPSLRNLAEQVDALRV